MDEATEEIDDEEAGEIELLVASKKGFIVDDEALEEFIGVKPPLLP